MDTQLDKLVKEVTRCVLLQEPICIHFPVTIQRAKGLRALDRYGFLLCTGDSLVDNSKLRGSNWFCSRTISNSMYKRGLYVYAISEDFMMSNVDKYKARIRAEEFVYSNFRRHTFILNYAVFIKVDWPQYELHSYQIMLILKNFIGLTSSLHSY